MAKLIRWPRRRAHARCSNPGAASAASARRRHRRVCVRAHYGRCAALSDGQRASTMAVFRVLLNGLVIAVLLGAGYVPEHAVYATASAMLVVCLLGSHVLAMPSDAHGESRGAGGSGASSEEVPIIAVPERGGLSKKRSPTESPELDDAE